MNRRAITLTVSVPSDANRVKWKKTDENTVVTRDVEGKPVSFFFQDSWCIDPYKANSEHRHLHFRPVSLQGTTLHLVEDTQYQVKQVVYLLMHVAYDEVPSPETMKAKLSILRNFSQFSAKDGHTLYEGFSDLNTIFQFIRNFQSAKQREKKSRRLHAILVSLNRLGFDRAGVEIPMKKVHEFLMQYMHSGPAETQHPVIPTRIYQHLLVTCEMELQKVETAAASIFKILTSMYSVESLPTTPPRRIKELLEYYQIPYSKQGVLKLFTTIATLCQLIILAFTGMRVDEVRGLPFNCLTTSHQDGVERFIIEGITTKLAGGKEKRARWVTSHLAARAIRFSQRFSSIVHHHHGVFDFHTSSNSRCLLFCQTGLLISKYHSNRSFSQREVYLEEFCERASLSITSEDIAELKNIDPLRAWDSEVKFTIGARWPFTRHQLRRTLALYAHRSGLVSLPSLKRQLQHITLEMSMYYARGSAFAKDFIGNNRRHFAHQWRDNQGLSEYLAYASKVLFSDERLFGAHANWAKSQPVKQSPVSVYTRDAAIAMFKRGEIAFKETALGACTSIERCKSLPIDWLSLECLEKDCKNLVVIPSKLQRAVKAQKSVVDSLRKRDEESVEYRIEANTLEILVSAQRRFSRRART